MNNEADVLPPPVEKAAAISPKCERRDPWNIAAAVFWKLPVIVGGILVGAIVALFLGLFLGWINIAC